MADEERIGTTFIMIIQTNLAAKMPVYPPLSNLLKKHKERKMATLMNQRCEMWHVNFVCKGNGNRVYMKGRGWKKFMKDNSLEKGYVLEVEYKGNLIFMVRIYDHSTQGRIYIKVAQRPSSALDSTCEKEVFYVSSSESEEDHSDEISNEIYIKKTTMFKEMEQRVRLGHKLVLKRTIQKSNFSSGYFRIPAWFAILSGVDRDHDEITIENPEGKCWQVGITHHPKTYGGFLISHCWGEVARSSGLKQGSIIELEWVPDHQVCNRTVYLKMRKM